jgi:hypothetical protein
MVSAIAFIGAYATQLYYGNAEVPGTDKKRVWRRAQLFNVLTVAMVFGSVAIFFAGCVILLFSWP